MSSARSHEVGGSGSEGLRHRRTTVLGLNRSSFTTFLRSLLAVACAACLAPPVRAQTGVEWQPLTLDQALEKANAQNSMVLVDVWAGHCGACGQMDIDVWQTPRGAKLAQGLIPIKIDSTTPEGRALSERYPITGLPSVLFIRPDGTELDRVTGYFEKEAFYREAEPLHDGVDPMPLMEKELQAHPDSLPLLLTAMERYQNRRRDAEADSMFHRILRADTRDRQNYAERAIAQMGRYQELIAHDYDRAVATWKMMIDLFPGSMSVGGALDGIAREYQAMGRRNEWLTWVCGVLEKNPSAMTLQRQAVMVALHSGYRGHCLAEAARRSRAVVPSQTAMMDSIATVMDQ
jgi:hypothetical protein